MTFSMYISENKFQFFQIKIDNLNYQNVTLQAYRDSPEVMASHIDKEDFAFLP